MVRDSLGRNREPSPNRRAAERRDLPVTGMSCAACVSNVEAAIGAVPGVTGVVVNLATQRATLAIEPGADLSAVQAAVERAGLWAVIPSAGAGSGNADAMRDAEAAARAAETKEIRRAVSRRSRLRAPGARSRDVARRTGLSRGALAAARVYRPGALLRPAPATSPGPGRGCGTAPPT